MNKYGISKKRMEQLKAKYGDHLDNYIEEILDYGPDEVNRGYDMFYGHLDNACEIESIDIVGAFTCDEDAAKQAEKDGFCKIIPVEELPEDFEYRRFGWVDTPENRAAIESYCKRAGQAT